MSSYAEAAKSASSKSSRPSAAATSVSSSVREDSVRRGGKDGGDARGNRGERQEHQPRQKPAGAGNQPSLPPIFGYYEQKKQELETVRAVATWPVPSSRSSDIPVPARPEFDFEQPLNLQRSPEAADKPGSALKLVEAVKDLAEKLVYWKAKEPSLMDAFCLELRRCESGQWKMRMRLNVDSWFRLLLTEQGTSAASHLGRTYIHEVNAAPQGLQAEQAEQEQKGQSHRNTHNPLGGIRAESSRSTSSPSLCCVGEQTQLGPVVSSGPPNAHMVFDMVSLKMGFKERCNWWSTPELELVNSDDWLWLILARPQQEREVLLFPKPPENHMSNQDLVQDESGWEAVIHALDLIENKTHAQSDTESSSSSSSSSLPSTTAASSSSSSSNPALASTIRSTPSVDRIVVKFGEWETQTSKNVFSISCHAHVHFYITKQAVAFCATLPESDPFSKLRCADRDPEEFTARDAASLERIIGNQTEVDDLRREVNELRSEVHQLRVRTGQGVHNNVVVERTNP